MALPRSLQFWRWCVMASLPSLVAACTSQIAELPDLSPGCPPGTAQIACGGVCVDPMASAANCGACGHACGSDEDCAGGACKARCPGLTSCGGVCKDLKSD